MIRALALQRVPACGDESVYSYPAYKKYTMTARTLHNYIVGRPLWGAGRNNDVRCESTCVLLSRQMRFSEIETYQALARASRQCDVFNDGDYRNFMSCRILFLRRDGAQENMFTDL